MDINHPSYTCRKDNPSFSSTLLDVIYRSIEDERESMSDVAVDRRQKSATVFDSLNSDDSSGSRYGIAEIYGFPARPRPIRTVNIRDDDDESYCKDTRETNDKKRNKSGDLKTKADYEGKFVKAKSRAMKIYGYLKKGKQPISPGGRLATFLISLFRNTNAKKSKKSKPYDHDEAMIVHANMKSNSSSSSFSRSFLSKTPSSSWSRKAISTGIKRSSVRFHPASGGDGSDPATRYHEEVKHHNLAIAGQTTKTSVNILKNYPRKQVEYVLDSIKNADTNVEEDEDEGASCTSSDLFELDHLSAIGIDECMKELPLYETTNVDVNRAIANRLLSCDHHQK